jgi:hypothetical protein
VEKRRTRRFSLQLPIAITRNGTERVLQTGVTKNISSGGILFTADEEPDLGISIEYVITLGVTEQNVSLRCIGKVVRCERVGNGAPQFEIAATLERYEFVRPEE